ncbi:MAG: peptide chain release factor N(5)-glutamine methyltransferase [Desulfobacteraceae bacterium]|nr:peptide chain release factor N(5)-glutamine methyltransferase [Desulfobacteraceae bacterium]MBC2718000.1 peptide chain release factor N(5)-glutamine methyltransferase [Desulfobacteraceae bacterium]
MQNQPNSEFPEWTIIKLLNWTTSYFKSHNIDSPRSTSEILLAHTLGLKRIDLYLRYDQPLTIDELSLFKTYIKKRINREPVAYIVGTREFWSMDLSVTKDVLIPRPETECLVESALSLLELGHWPKRILELGTGSGAITLALASEMKEYIYFASDYSVEAVKLAFMNATHHHLDGKINFFSGDWLDPLKNTGQLFDMIISNPPYIKTLTLPELQPEIHKYEPLRALDGGKTGLDSIKKIIFEAHVFLVQKGILLLEIGHDQKNQIKKIIDNCGNYENVVFKKDYSAYYRMVCMRKK